MKKYYSTDIKNWENINVFEEIQNDWTQEENNVWSTTDKLNFDWWKEVADAIEFLEDNGINTSGLDVNEIADYVAIAKENGF